MDYTKIVIIKNADYIETATAVVDADEYKETRDNIDYIKNDAQTYIDDYIQYMQKGIAQKEQRKFTRKYGFSTLQYFHVELGI